MSTIAGVLAKAGFPLGFLMFGLYLIFRAKKDKARRAILIAIGIVMCFTGGGIYLGSITLSQSSSGDCGGNSIFSLFNQWSCK